MTATQQLVPHQQTLGPEFIRVETTQKLLNAATQGIIRRSRILGVFDCK